VQYIIVDISSTDILYGGSYTCDFTVTAVKPTKAVKALEEAEEYTLKTEDRQKTIKSSPLQVIPVLILAALIPTARHNTGKSTGIKRATRKRRRYFCINNIFNAFLGVIAFVTFLSISLSPVIR